MIQEDLYMECRRMKRAMSGHMEYLASVAKDKVCVEFGVRGGGSTAALLSTASKVYSYDIHVRRRDEPMWTRFKEAWPTWDFVMGNSLEVVIPECDVLVLDDLHRYTHVLTELNLHHAFVSERICIHDTAVFAEHGQEAYEAGGNVGAGPDKKSKGLDHAIDDFLSREPLWFEERRVMNDAGMVTLHRRS